MPFIISVGNLALGGTGKTPFTTFLAQKYSADGEKVAVLSRGYKGKIGYGSHIISDGNKFYLKPPLAADEPYMIGQSVPGSIIITGKNRNKSYEIAVEKYNPSIFLLDDGFQHRKMRRDVDIVLLDYAKPVSTGFMFPFGYLREFPSALKRADIIVFTRANGTQLPDKAKKYCADKPVFFSEFLYGNFCSVADDMDNTQLNGGTVWLMSGIAHNDQFSNQIKRYPVKIAGHTKYADHHAYTADELDKVILSAKRANSDFIVTTQKDFVKIPEELAKYFIYPNIKVNLLNSGLFEAIDKIRTPK